MKTLMKILSIFLIITGAIVVISLITSNNSNNDFIQKITNLYSDNLLPFVSIAICTYCLEKNDTNYILRIIPAYLIIPIVLSMIIIFAGINEGFIFDLYNFLKCTYLEITILSFISVIKPSNVVSNCFRYISYLAFAVAFILVIAVYLRSKSMDSLTSYKSALDLIKAYTIATVAEGFSLLILYISNYAFSEKIELETEDIDYDLVKQQAETLANVQMNNMYNLSQKKNEPDRSASENGLMNVNNQLLQNSNVGTVKEQAKEVNISGSTLDSLMPLSKGPVINSTVQEEKIVETTPQVLETTPITTPPNLDIQEQMKLRMEQNK